MATSQMIAAAISGRYMSAFWNAVSPALKLMKVLTTATEAREIPTAAGIPSSRTRPDVCRMNKPPRSPLASLALTSLVATCRPPVAQHCSARAAETPGVSRKRRR